MANPELCWWSNVNYPEFLSGVVQCVFQVLGMEKRYAQSNGAEPHTDLCTYPSLCIVRTDHTSPHPIWAWATTESDVICFADCSHAFRLWSCSASRTSWASRTQLDRAETRGGQRIIHEHCRFAICPMSFRYFAGESQ